jgi:hypothetical protein
MGGPLPGQEVQLPSMVQTPTATFGSLSPGFVAQFTRQASPQAQAEQYLQFVRSLANLLGGVQEQAVGRLAQMMQPKPQPTIPPTPFLQPAAQQPPWVPTGSPQNPPWQPVWRR